MQSLTCPQSAYRKQWVALRIKELTPEPVTRTEKARAFMADGRWRTTAEIAAEIGGRHATVYTVLGRIGCERMRSGKNTLWRLP